MLTQAAVAALLACAALGCSGSGSGSSAAVPGLVGSTCDDVCVAYLNSLGSFQSLPDWPRFVFSASGDEGFLPEGDDANPCTEELPCKSADRMQEVLDQHGTIVVLDHDRWDGGDELADFGGFLLDNTGCGSGAPTMEDVPCAFIVPLRSDRLEESRPTFDCSGASRIDGNPTPFMRIGGSGSGYFGRAGIAIQRCPQNPGANGGSSEYVTWLLNPPTVPGGRGHLVDVNVLTLDVPGSHAHAVRVASTGASFVGIGTGGTMRDHADFDSDCTGERCADRDPVPQPLCEVGSPGVPYDCCDGGSPVAQCTGRSHFYETAQPGFTVVSARVHEIRGTQFPPRGAGHACFVSDCRRGGCDNALVGVICKPPASVSIGGSPSASSCFSNLFPGDGLGLTAYWAGLTCLPWPAAAAKTYAFRVFDNSDTPDFDDTATVHLFQSTATGAEVGVLARGQFEGDTGVVIGRSNAFDELEAVGSDAFVARVVGSNLGRVLLDFDGSNVYDVDDGVPFACGNDRHATAAEVPRDDCNTRADDDTDVSADFFGSTFGGAEGPLESGGPGVDGDVFTEEASCRRGAVCDGASRTTLAVPLHASAFIPSAVTRADRVIETIVRGSHHTDAGAR